MQEQSTGASTCAAAGRDSALLQALARSHAKGVMWPRALPQERSDGLPPAEVPLGASPLLRLPLLGASLALGSAVGQLPQRPMRLSSTLRRAAGGRLIATGRFTSCLVSPAASWLQGRGAQQRTCYWSRGDAGFGQWYALLLLPT